MRIEFYFQKIQKTIELCPISRMTHITVEKRSSHTGLIIAEVTFLDESVLQIREFIDVESSEDRLMYAFHYMNASKEIIFRYDNTGHHKKLNLSTYPHHKHDGSEDNVIAAFPAELASVLEEIERVVL
ncbi:MAG: DUF6516 family protein [Pseudomonadota bacterium]